MSANRAPIWTQIPNVAAVTPTAASAKSDGSGTIGTDIFLAFTAGTNGSWVEKIRMAPTASVANSTTTATVARIFISSATSGAVTNANCFLFDELTLPSLTAASSTGQAQPVERALGFFIPAGWTILVSNHAAPAASTGWKATVFGGDY